MERRGCLHAAFIGQIDRVAWCGTIRAVKEPAASPEYKAFKGLLNRLIAVPHAEITQREADYKKQSALNPSKPGPKPKLKRGAGRVPAV